MDPTNEQEALIRRILAGDNDSFQQLVSAHSLMLRSFLSGQLYRPDEVDDLAQEVFITALEKLPTFELGSDLGAWLRGIARYKLQNHFRSVTRRTRAMDRFHQEVMGIVEPEFETLAAEKNHASIEVLLRCIEQLPERMRSVVRAGLEDRKGEQLAEEMETTRSAIYNLQHRANKLLKECIEKEYTNESGT